MFVGSLLRHVPASGKSLEKIRDPAAAGGTTSDGCRVLLGSNLYSLVPS